jgi:hypothetical protein
MSAALHTDTIAATGITGTVRNLVGAHDAPSSLAAWVDAERARELGDLGALPAGDLPGLRVPIPSYC